MKHFLLAAACLGLLGMSAPGWRCPPSDGLANLLFQHEIPKTWYCTVNDVHLKFSVEKLRDHAFLKLSKAEFDNYASTCKFGSKRFTYLVRALDVSGQGWFEVYEYGGILYVTSGVLGTSAGPRRTALVLSTKVPISKVYVNYFVAK